MAARGARQIGSTDDASSVNTVRLRGRLAVSPVERELPSGDTVAVFRVVVDRPAVRAASGSSARVDTLDCAAFRADVRRKLARWEPGDVIEITGSLRRRFFRAAGSAASRYEVEVRSVVRVARASGKGRVTMPG